MKLSRISSAARPISQRMTHTFSTHPVNGDNKPTKNIAERALKTVSTILHAAIIPHVTLGYLFSKTAQTVVGTERFLKNSDIEESPDKKAFELYRAITPEELDRLIENPHRSLFSGSTSTLDSSKPSDPFLHVVSSSVYDQNRHHTSFSTEQISARKFAYQSPAYGVVAKFQIPKQLVLDHVKPGTGTYEELLLPTKLLTLSMVDEIEIRPGKEFENARYAERMAESPTTFGLSHHFSTPPAGVFKMTNYKLRSDAKMLLNELTIDHEIEEAHEAARIPEPSMFTRIARYLNTTLVKTELLKTDY